MGNYFAPTKAGIYKVQAFYPGQTLTGTNPYNSNASTQDYHKELLGSKMLPTNSSIYDLTVQNDPITMSIRLHHFQLRTGLDQYWHLTGMGNAELPLTGLD